MLSNQTSNEWWFLQEDNGGVTPPSTNSVEFDDNTAVGFDDGTTVDYY